MHMCEPVHARVNATMTAVGMQAHTSGRGHGGVISSGGDLVEELVDAVHAPMPPAALLEDIGHTIALVRRPRPKPLTWLQNPKFHMVCAISATHLS